MTEEIKNQQKPNLTCQKCKHHKNNPSFCKIDNKHIGRKQPICLNFETK